MTCERTRLDVVHTVAVRPCDKQEIGPKPGGLWYEVDGDWRRWCASESPQWIDGRYLHRVAIGEERLLFLAGAAEIDCFGERYGIGRGPYLWEIDWPRVAGEYDGIQIAPYCWERRLDGRESNWYYGWDCASGCIWRPRGVSVELIEGPLAVARCPCGSLLPSFDEGGQCQECRDSEVAAGRATP